MIALRFERNKQNEHHILNRIEEEEEEEETCGVQTF